jgi:hypothetical protein
VEEVGVEGGPAKAKRPQEQQEAAEKKKKKKKLED